MKGAPLARKYSSRISIKVVGLLLLLGMMLVLVTGPVLVVGSHPPPPLEDELALGRAGQVSPEEHGLGLLPSDPAEYPTVPLPPRIAAITELPLVVDLSQPSLIQGQPSDDGIPPVGDQWFTNTCVGWAASYYYKTYQEWREHGFALENGGANYDRIFSVNFVYNQITDNDEECDDGARIGDALELIASEGDVPWSILPWRSYYCDSQPTQAQQDAALFCRGIDYGPFFISVGPPYGPEQNHNLTPLKQWLAAGDPFLIGFPVYSEFDYPGCDSPVTPPENPSSYRGLHAVMVVGYKDNFAGEGAFEIVNSWGSYWGCDGYAWLSYEFVRKYAWEAWWMTDDTVPSINPTVPDRFAQVGNSIVMNLNPYENECQDIGIALKWRVEGEDHCTVFGEESNDDVLTFQPEPGYMGYDDIILRLVDSEGAEDTQQVKLGWFDFRFFSYLPLALRNYSY